MAEGDFTASLPGKRPPQPSFIGLLASGWSPVNPCHVPPREYGQHPIGTGPFKFVEFKPNEHIKLTRNPDYLEAGPAPSHVDGIEYTRSSAAPLDLDPGAEPTSSIAPGPGFVPISLLKEIKSQAPEMNLRDRQLEHQPHRGSSTARWRRTTKRNCAGRSC